MTKEELAKQLDGREYRKEITKAEEKQAAEHGLVVIFGASDDLMEFRGAVDVEIGACDGAVALMDSSGLLPQRENIADDEALENFFFRRRAAKKVEALWCKEGEYSWTFKTEIPHATFEIADVDASPYCRGIVISLKEIAA